MPDVDVAIVGAGLAGLACAGVLHRAGRSVAVLESADAVGGRVRTDEVDGFRLDRGFQVLLTGYPALRAHVDLDALDLQAFSPGVTVRRRGRFVRLADPTREPGSALSALRVATPLDGLRLLRWRQRLLHTPGAELASAPQTTTAELLRARGFSEELVASFFHPFVSGTFFDPDLTTSSRFTELVFRSFFRGEVTVPATGMQRLPEQLAAALPDDTVRLGRRVEAIDRGEVHTAAGTTTADHVVVATDAPAATVLLAGRAEVTVTPRDTTTLWYGAATSPIEGPDLVLAADRDGPVTTVAPMSRVSSAYAPPGRALLGAALTGVPGVGDRDLDRIVRAQLRGWWGSPVDDWTLLRVDRIPFAQPRMDPADLPTLRREVRVDERTWICGDHRDTASLQGAMVSGRRTAEAVLAA